MTRLQKAICGLLDAIVGELHGDSRERIQQEMDELHVAVDFEERAARANCPASSEACDNCAHALHCD